MSCALDMEITSEHHNEHCEQFLSVRKIIRDWKWKKHHASVTASSFQSVASVSGGFICS